MKHSRPSSTPTLDRVPSASNPPTLSLYIIRMGTRNVRLHFCSLGLPRLCCALSALRCPPCGPCGRSVSRASCAAFVIQGHGSRRVFWVQKMWRTENATLCSEAALCQLPSTQCNPSITKTNTTLAFAPRCRVTHLEGSWSSSCHFDRQADDRSLLYSQYCHPTHTPPHHILGTGYNRTLFLALRGERGCSPA